ncbi:MAG: asparaginase [Burkholderiaceae bacterium]|nr:asparaginase [Burkholderiaceae bacterium]
MPSTLKRIVVLATSGTISMKVDASGAAFKALNAADLVALLPPIEDVAIEAVDFEHNIGYSVTNDMMLALATQVTRLCSRQDVDAVVVTHGTDVMEEVATLVDLMVKSHKPIVFTGAMRNASMLGSDGPHNLLSAMRIAAFPGSAGRGVLICMNDSIHAARAVTKTHTSLVSTFDSPNLGAIGYIDNNVPHYKDLRLSWPHYGLPKVLMDVPLIWVYAGQSTALFELAVSQTRGVVIAAKGIGHVPAWWMPHIRQAVDNGVVIVVASQCGSGSTGLQYGGPGSDRDLLDAGAIFAGYRRPLQARLELMCAISSGLSTDGIRDAFATSSLGAV